MAALVGAVGVSAATSGVVFPGVATGWIFTVESIQFS
jgi:hypothetical protein